MVMDALSSLERRNINTLYTVCMPDKLVASGISSFVSRLKPLTSAAFFTSMYSEEIFHPNANLVLFAVIGFHVTVQPAQFEVGQPVLVDPITEGIGNFPVMILAIAAIKIIHSHKIVRFKGIGEFISNNKVPVVADLIGIVIIPIAV